MGGGEVGVTFDNGCRITHGHGANIKKPFPEISLTMHELSPGNKKGFSGQLGFIPFTSELRLPRHIHMNADKTKLVDERILVLHGVGVVEIAGKVYVTAPGTLVDAIGGVPHTWSACPAGVQLPDGSVSDGKFTMVYEYEEPTSFFPTESTTPITAAADYEAFEGDDFDPIRFPQLTAQEIVEQAVIVFNTDVQKLSLAELPEESTEKKRRL